MDEVIELIKKEEKRQRDNLTLIASENYPSKAVRKALGSMLSNKYSEGFPGRRYYQGNKIIDEIEQIAIDRAKSLFKVPHVNVQPYSGSPANSAVEMAVLEAGDTIMGMQLSGGGHLTHGHPKITFSGRFFKSVQYGVNSVGLIDFDEMEKLALEAKPKLIIAGTTAYPRTLEWAKFAQIAEKVGAYLLADISHISGLVVTGYHESPVAYADFVTTTTHKTLRGPRGAMAMVTEKGLNKDADLAKKVDRGVFPGLQGGPHNSTTAAIAIALKEATTPAYKKYIGQVVKNARYLAQRLLDKEYGVTTGGTDNHLMVVDLRSKGVGGKDAAIWLENAGIVANYNAVPHDTNPPNSPSGIRLGTPAVTTRGLKEPEMKKVADWISQIIEGRLEDSKDIRKQVLGLCRQYPLD